MRERGRGDTRTNPNVSNFLSDYKQKEKQEFTQEKKETLARLLVQCMVRDAEKEKQV